MKILWVNPSFLDYRVPVYKRLNELTGGNFYLIYSRNRMSQRVIDKIEISLGKNAIGLHNEKTFGISGKGDFANTEYKFPYQPGLYKAISSIDADIIIGEGFFQWTPLALLRARLNKKKFLLAYERTAHTERNCPKWRTAYRQLISKFVDGYSSNGQLTKEYLMEIGVKEDKIFLGGMSADSENLVTGVNSYPLEEQIRFKSTLNIKKGLTFLYAGQMNERKGVIHLLRAWRKHTANHPNDTLIGIGVGPLLARFKDEFSDLNSIKLLGMIDYDLIYKYYAIADVFIIPTLEDNWSLVVPEAMACGLPIACSIYNGCFPELVHEGTNGKLFDPLDESSILKTLTYFHSKDLKAMGVNSINIEKDYNAVAVAQHIYTSFKLLLHK